MKVTEAEIDGARCFRRWGEENLEGEGLGEVEGPRDGEGFLEEGDKFLEEEQLEEESGFGEQEEVEVWGEEDGGRGRLPHSPSPPEESSRSPSEEIRPSDSSQDLDGRGGAGRE